MNKPNHQQISESPQSSHIQINIEPEKNLQPFDLLLITWNLMGTLPSLNSLNSLLQTQRTNDIDLLVIGTQECENTLFTSFFYQSKAKWQSMIQEVLALRGFIKVQSHVLQGLHLIILAHSKKYLYITDKKKNMIKTGFCNIVGNKGGISIELLVNKTKLIFANVHLAANQDEIQHRNISLLQIVQSLLPQQKKGFCFIFGDMNYRMNLTNQQSKNFNIKDKSHTFYLKKDQMASQIELQQFRNRFKQGIITFPPTYKMKSDKNQYVANRIPGWTDRIFYSQLLQLKLKQYYSDHDVFDSDHRPVIGKFQLMISQPDDNYGQVQIKTSGCLLF